MKRFIKLQKGLTLIELLVYMGLFSILLIPLMRLFASIIAVRLESEATSAVIQDGRYILSKLSYDIHRASDITSPVLGSSDSTLHIRGTGIDYTYKLDGGNLVVINNNIGPKEISLNGGGTDIPQISFTTLGNGTGKNVVSINMKVESKVIRQGGKKELKTFQTIVGIR